MNGRLSRHTAERMLRGERVGPPALGDLLAAAAAPPGLGDPGAEEAEERAVAAFRARPRPPARRPRARRSRLFTAKAVLFGVALAGAGGAAAVAVAHETGPSAPREAPVVHESVGSRTTETRGTAVPPRAPGEPRTAAPHAGQKRGHGAATVHGTAKPKPAKKHKPPTNGKGNGTAVQHGR